MAANWQQVVNKIDDLLVGRKPRAENLSEWNAWKKSLEKWEIADRREGPSPGEPSGATPSETPPASDDADTPVQGRWRTAVGKWEHYADSADTGVQERDEPVASSLAAGEENSTVQLDEVLRLLLSLTEDMRAVMSILGVRAATGGPAHGSSRSGGAGHLTTQPSRIGSLARIALVGVAAIRRTT